MRKLIAVIFSICLVIPLLFASQIAIGTASWILDEQFYVHALDDEKVYQAVLSDNILDGILRRQLALPAETDTSGLRTIVRDILGKEYLKVQTSAIVSDFFDYLHGQTDQFKPVIDLQPVKSALTSEKQSEFLTALVAVMPVCQAGQTPGFGGADQSACKPQGIDDATLIENYLEPAMPAALAQIPDQLSLEGNWQNLVNRNPWGRFLPGMALPASLILAVLFLAFLAVCFWYITALIADGSWRVRLQWLGWTLILPSGLVFLLGILLQGNTPQYWLNYGLQYRNLQIQTGLIGAQTILEALSTNALPRVSASFLMVGGICGGLALGLILWGLMTPRKTD